MLKSISWSVVLTMLVASWTMTAHAQPPMPGQGYQPIPQGNGRTAFRAPPGTAPQYIGRPQRYPEMHAPLYPTPVPNVPANVGGTRITNPAFAPHEMLYPHEYKALYPPFYYKVSGGWWWTPWGMESHDKWKLQGTEVRVKYKSHISPFAGFAPPINW